MTSCPAAQPIARKGATMKDVYIYDAVRTPRGKGRADGSLHEVKIGRAHV